MLKHSARRIIHSVSLGSLLKYYKVFGKQITEFIEGQEITYDPNTDIGFVIYFQGNIENKEMRFYSKYVNNNSTVLDIGANIGLYSIYFSRKAKDGLVISFEPSRETFGLLLKNIKNTPNIIPLNLGVSDSSSITDLYIANDNAYSSLKDTKRKRIKYKQRITCIKLDDFVFQFNIEKIDFVKIDVEGLEQNVLEGMTKTIQHHHPVIVCEIYRGLNSNNNPLQTINLIKSMKYDAFVFNGDEFIKFSSHDDRYYNYLFIPKEII